RREVAQPGEQVPSALGPRASQTATHPTAQPRLAAGSRPGRFPEPHAARLRAAAAAFRQRRADSPERSAAPSRPTTLRSDARSRLVRSRAAEAKRAVLVASYRSRARAARRGGLPMDQAD